MYFERRMQLIEYGLRNLTFWIYYVGIFYSSER